MSNRSVPRDVFRKSGLNVSDAVVRSLTKNWPNTIQTDSRKLEKGDWFWPLVGEKFDGHEFINDAMQKGAAGFTFQKNRTNMIDSNLLIKGMGCQDTLESLQQIAKVWRRLHHDIPLIAITGSNGKTTAKELLGHILSVTKKCLYSKESFNNEIGVPLTLCQINDHHRFVITECGARHKGDIDFLVRLTDPSVAVLLNIGRAHLGEFGSEASLRETKQEMLTSSDPNACAVICRDDAHTYAVARSKHNRVVTFGRHPDSDVKIQHFDVDQKGGLLLDLSIQGYGNKNIRVPVFHNALIPNLAAAIACCVALDFPLEKACDRLQTFQGVRRRFEVHQIKDLVVIDDSYNANTQSMMSGLESLMKAWPDRKKILVLGDMLELGKDSHTEHSAIGAFIGKNLVCDFLVTVGQDSLWIGEAALSHGLPEAKWQHFSKTANLMEQLSCIRDKGNLLYAKASNSIRLYEVVDQLLTTN